MRLKLLYIAIITAACAAVVSCSDAVNPDGVPSPDASGRTVNLSFSVVAADAPGEQAAVSRAGVVTVPDGGNYFEDPEWGTEMLTTLRVIVVRTDERSGAKVIERNRFYYADAFPDKRVSDLKVKSGERTTIYLIANEAGTGIDFQTDYAEGASYTGTLETMTFGTLSDDVLLIDNSGGVKTDIPMSEVYELFVPQAEKDNETYDAGQMFVTRAAVKFSFSITQQNGNGLKIKAVKVTGLADRQYLLPHETTYEPPKTLADELKNPPGYYPPVDPDVSGRFITEYKIPDDAEHHPYTFTFDAELHQGVTTTLLPALYFCESRLSDEPNPYSVTVTIGGVESDTEWTFEPKELTNLPLLPRNTHVLVNIRLTGTDVDLTVDVQPFASVSLDPTFGLERDLINGYIVLRKDSKGEPTFYYDDLNDVYYDKWLYPLFTNWPSAADHSKTAQIRPVDVLPPGPKFAGDKTYVNSDLWEIKRATGSHSWPDAAAIHPDGQVSLYYDTKTGVYYDYNMEPLNYKFAGDASTVLDLVDEVQRDFTFNDWALSLGESGVITSFYCFAKPGYRGAINPETVGTNPDGSLAADNRREIRRDYDGWIEIRPYWTDKTECYLYFNVYTGKYYDRNGYCLQPDRIGGENTSFRFYASKDYTQVQLLSHGDTDVYEPKLTYNRYDGLYYEFASDRPFAEQLKQITITPTGTSTPVTIMVPDTSKGATVVPRPADLKIDGRLGIPND